MKGGKLLRKSGYPCLVLGDIPDVLSKKKKKKFFLFAGD